jgi:hypothetical protein
LGPEVREFLREIKKGREKGGKEVVAEGKGL